MSDKYIINNCPCYDYDYEECLNTFRDEYKKCYDCTDCVMKQIVELCKGVQDKEYRKGRRRFRSPSKASFGRDILQLLDIEEVE